MPKIEKSGTINASVDNVFEFVTTRENAPKFVPNLIRVWDIEPNQAGVGQAWKYEFRLLGLTFEGEAKISDFVPNQKLSFNATGKLDSTWTYELEPVGDQTKLSVSVEYDLPESLWAKIKDRIAYSRINESQAEQLLVNVDANFS